MKIQNNSKLWGLTRRDSEDIYILGTIHLPIDKINWNKTKVLQLLESVETYAGEMDLDEASDHQNSGFNLLPEGQSIDQILRLKTYNKIRKSIKKAFSLDIEHYKYLRPLLLQHLIDQQIVNGKEQVVDQYLWQLAKEKGKKCLGLESFRDQVRILEMIDVDFQLKNLRKISTNTSTYRKKLLKNVARYNTNNIKLLYTSSRKSLGPYKKMMIDNRNIIMAERIKGLAEKTSILVGVGAGHLYGKMGLLALMKREGFSAKPY